MFADDDADDKALFSEALNEIDPTIVCYLAADGTEVLKKLASKEFDRPDIIFLDINMPPMNGWQCLTALKKDPIWQSIPVIMYSTSSARRDVEIASHLGALCFYTKPDNYNDLRSFLRVVISNMDGDILSALKKSDVRVGVVD